MSFLVTTTVLSTKKWTITNFKLLIHLKVQVNLLESLTSQDQNSKLGITIELRRFGKNQQLSQEIY